MAGSFADRNMADGTYKAGGCWIFERKVVRDTSSTSLTSSTTNLKPDPEYENTALTASTMSDQEKELAICVSDRELRAEMQALRSSNREERAAALRRLKTHTVFEPRNVEPLVEVVVATTGKRGGGRKSSAMKAGGKMVVGGGMTRGGPGTQSAPNLRKA